MTNVSRHTASLYAQSPEAAAYTDIKAALDIATAEHDIDAMVFLKQELDMAAEACEYAYREAEREAREHYD